jgi:hypothetical protein
MRKIKIILYLKIRKDKIKFLIKNHIQKYQKNKKMRFFLQDLDRNGKIVIKMNFML